MATLAAFGSAIPETALRRTLADAGYRSLLGEAGWRSLSPNIRRRFAVSPALDSEIRYTGSISLACTWIGWLLAQLSRFAGTPLPSDRGLDLPASVTLRAVPDGGVEWRRAYRVGTREVVARSTKRVEPGGLIETAPRLIGMRLAISAESGALHFRSYRYFLFIGKWRLGLPDLITPGQLHVVHADLPQGGFRFTLEIRHRVLGTLFLQSGDFTEDGDL